MLENRLYVDGIDVYKEYGVYVVKDGWNELIAYPPLKTVTANDWMEQDGVEVDLSEPVLNTHEIQIRFACDFKSGTFFFFIDQLSDGAYHTFEIRSIGRTYKLRLVSAPNYKEVNYFGTVTLKFADDFPLSGYTYQAPQSSLPEVEDYLFDETPFTKYGARVLKGALDEIKKPSNVKTYLLRNISNLSGAIYDSGANVFYKSKDVKLQLLFRAETLTDLWRNYYALLYDLIRAGERKLFVRSLYQEFPFYYKSCQVNKFYPTGKIWLQITLTLHFITDFRIDDHTILATETDIPVITEQGDYAIELNPLKY